MESKQLTLLLVVAGLASVHAKTYQTYDIRELENYPVSSGYSSAVYKEGAHSGVDDVVYGIRDAATGYDHQVSPAATTYDVQAIHGVQPTSGGYIETYPAPASASLYAGAAAVAAAPSYKEATYTPVASPVYKETAYTPVYQTPTYVKPRTAYRRVYPLKSTGLRRFGKSGGGGGGPSGYVRPQARVFGGYNFPTHTVSYVRPHQTASYVHNVHGSGGPGYAQKYDPCHNKPEGDYPLAGPFRAHFPHHDPTCYFVKCANYKAYTNRCSYGTKNDEYGEGFCSHLDHYYVCGAPPKRKPKVKKNVYQTVKY